MNESNDDNEISMQHVIDEYLKNYLKIGREDEDDSDTMIYSSIEERKKRNLAKLMKPYLELNNNKIEALYDRQKELMNMVHKLLWHDRKIVDKYTIKIWGVINKFKEEIPTLKVKWVQLMKDYDDIEQEIKKEHASSEIPEVEENKKVEEKTDLFKMFDVFEEIKEQLKVFKASTKTKRPTEQAKLTRLINKAKALTNNNVINQRLFNSKLKEVMR